MIGSVVGNYKIIDKIGEGGMGAVFKGVDLMLEREVAIKMLRPELARQPTRRRTLPHGGRDPRETESSQRSHPP